MNKTMKVTVNNVPARGCERYVVARVSYGELWYWGSWDDKEKAKGAALALGGIVLERIEEV